MLCVAAAGLGETGLGEAGLGETGSVKIGLGETYCFGHKQLQLEFSYGLLVNDSLADFFCQYPRAAQWLNSIMAQEAQSGRLPDRLYLAGAYLARLEPMDFFADLYDQLPDASQLLDTCLQSVYQVSPCAAFRKAD